MKVTPEHRKLIQTKMQEYLDSDAFGKEGWEHAYWNYSETRKVWDLFWRANSLMTPDQKEQLREYTGTHLDTAIVRAYKSLT